VGRHFRLGKNKIIVGRDEKENRALLEERGRNDLAFEVSGVPGPISVLQGLKTKKAIELAAKFTAFYADAETAAVKVSYGRERLDKSLIVAVPNRTEVEALRIRS
jgi:predicted ribosome quality control (RQC) complex YloA/Tae2 family protein